MRIKTKLSLGLAFLFAVILLMGGLWAYFTQRLASASNQIIRDNYESVQYANGMFHALDVLNREVVSSVFRQPSANRPFVSAYQSASYQQALQRFEKNLKAEENNLTEAGERETAHSLRKSFESLKMLIVQLDGKLDIVNTYFSQIVPQQTAVRNGIIRVSQINLAAINRKNERVQQEAQHALTLLSLIGTLCFIVTFTFILNFPGYIANPISELSESITQIANRNYQQRLHFESNDEFGELANAFNRMARKLDEYEHSNLARLLFEKKRLDTVINQLSDAIIGLDEEQFILFVNGSALSLLGVEKEALIGEFGPDIALENELMALVLDGFSHDKRGTTAENKPLQITLQSREMYFMRELLEVAVPSDENNLQSIGHVIILKNVTQYQEVNAAKTNFLATVSHELKTPLSAINMSLRLLDNQRVGELNEEQHELVDNIRDETQRLLRITGELLDLVQVETGKIQLHYRLTPPLEILHYAREALKVAAQQKTVQLQIEAAPDLPEVNADSEKTAWVLVNFLSNAIRYSPPGETVWMKAEYSAGYITFSVKDAGPGIAKEYQEKVFEKFFRVPGSSNFASGTGLGLAISKDFILAQGGRIWVESHPGQGSTFLFSLPVGK